MTAKLRVGVIGLDHDHVWGNLAALATGELGRLVAVSEPDAALRERLARTHGGVETHDSHEALLERRDLDAVLAFTDNRAAAELAARALRRGLPVMVEKPMAADLAGADALLAAARRRRRTADGQLADRLAAGPSSWPGPARRRRGRRAGAALASRRPRRAPGIRLFDPVLRLALRPGAQRRRRARRLLRLRRDPRARRARAAVVGDRGGRASPQGGPARRGQCGGGVALSTRARGAGGELDPDRRRARVRRGRLRRRRHAAGPPAARGARGPGRGRGPRAGRHRRREPLRRAAAAARRRARRRRVFPLPHPRRAPHRGAVRAGRGRDVQEVLAAALEASATGRAIALPPA